MLATQQPFLLYQPTGSPLDGRTVSEAVHRALAEDLAAGDVTTDPLAPLLAGQRVTAFFRARRACTVSGLLVAAEVCRQVDPALVFEARVQDGDEVPAHADLARVTGPVASLLKAERTALNFLQHLSGIATETQKFVAAVAGTPTRIAHTRKTTPGLRALEQQAVLHGGGVAHRFNLGQAAMLKDNHLQATGGNVEQAIALIRAAHPDRPLVVEVDNLDQLRRVLVTGRLRPGEDAVLLDNMTPARVRKAVQLISGQALAEVSGGVTLTTVCAYAEAGADVISTSQITLGAPAVDVGLDF